MLRRRTPARGCQRRGSISHPARSAAAPRRAFILMLTALPPLPLADDAPCAPHRPAAKRRRQRRKSSDYSSDGSDTDPQCDSDVPLPEGDATGACPGGGGKPLLRGAGASGWLQALLRCLVAAGRTLGAHNCIARHPTPDCSRPGTLRLCSGVTQVRCNRMADALHATCGQSGRAWQPEGGARASWGAWPAQCVLHGRQGTSQATW
jgi:hypothetical protein